MAFPWKWSRYKLGWKGLWHCIGCCTWILSKLWYPSTKFLEWIYLMNTRWWLTWPASFCPSWWENGIVNCVQCKHSWCNTIQGWAYFCMILTHFSLQYAPTVGILCFLRLWVLNKCNDVVSQILLKMDNSEQGTVYGDKQAIWPCLESC
jgi:hypothetical protein